jgi:hypothetical protein
MTSSLEPKRRASIIIPTHNGADCLGPCLASLRGQIGPEDEVIVVDDASSDGSADLVARLWPEARLYRNQSSAGFAEACNLGAEHAAGDTLVFLNQDTEVLPGWLDGLLEALASDERIALVTSRQLYMAQPGLVHNCGADLHYSGLIFLRGVLQRSDAYIRPAEEVHSVVGASFAARRDLWRTLGGFNARFFMYYEEMDLSWRAQLAGYRSVYAPASVVYHDVPLSGVSFNKLYHICRNRQICVLSHWRWPTLILLGPGLLLAELVEFGYVCLGGGWAGVRAKLRAYRWLLRNLSRMTQWRRESQALRHVPDWLMLTKRTWTVDPKEFTGGKAGRILARVASIPLLVSGWLAWRICRLFGW